MALLARDVGPPFSSCRSSLEFIETGRLIRGKFCATLGSLLDLHRAAPVLCTPSPMVTRGACITVSGLVVRVRTRRDGGWRVRLTDTGGALAAGEIRLW